MRLLMLKLRPTEERLLAILNDGRSHLLSELRICLDDPLAENVALRVWISNLRKKLKPLGRYILCEENHGKECTYRQVRRLASSDD